MKFSVGYQMMSNRAFMDAILAYRDRIHEVYFSWGGYANGRNSQLRQMNLTSWEALRQQEADLKFLSENGLKLNLLFNAMCYGKDSQSRSFFEGIGNTVDYISTHFGLASVTTTSPLIARFIKENFSGIDVRASVNMGIGTIEGMDYVKDCFDSFYMKRELNRDFGAIARLKLWCDDHGKTLYALANSGCLNHCSAHTFHDNLVAHEQEISQMDNGFAFEGICRQYLSDPSRQEAFLTHTGFIRPEDIHHYETLFPAMKLATRVSPVPVQILRAYMNGKHIGAVTDLLEPNHSGLLYPYVLDNNAITSTVCEDKLLYGNFDNARIRLEEETCLLVK